MKVLAVLVLVFLTGCNGGHYQHPSQSQVEMVQDAFWDYVQKSTRTSKDYVWEIRFSSPGRYLCSIISQSVDIVYKFFRLVYAHIVIWTTNFFHKICHEVDHLCHHLQDFLYHLEADVHYHAKELAAQIRCKLEDIKKVAAHYIEALDPKGLKMALLEKTKDLNEHLEKCYELLHTHHHHHHGHHHQHPGHHHGHHHQHHGHHHGHHHQHPGHHHGHHHQHHGHHHQHPGHHHGHHHQHHGHYHGHHHGHHHQHHGHHHGHHHQHHGHHHQHHGHHHCEPETKKKINESMEEFKTSLFSLVHKFEIELAQTTKEINKKLVPHGKRYHGKLIKNSDHLKNELESIWQDWLSLSEKKTY